MLKLTASLITLLTLGAGVTYAQAPKTIQTHPATQTQTIKETQPNVVEILPAGVPKDPSKRCPQWEPKIAEAGLPVQTFSYIAWREARCQLKSVNARWNNQGQITWTLNKNGSYDSGLFAINSGWHSIVQQVCNIDTGSKRRDLRALYNIDCSLAMAVWIMENTKGKLGNWNL